MAKKVIALTGGIGSGKSTAGRFFCDLGYMVIDADQVSRCVANQKEVLESIQNTFGDGFVVDGVLNRKALAKEVFCSATKTQLLNEIFHTKIYEQLKKAIDDSLGVVLVEIPLLEERFLDLFDEIWAFVANAQSVLDRVKQRDNRSEQQVRDIVDKQKKYESVQATLTVYNDGTLEEFKQKLTQLLDRLN